MLNFNQFILLLKGLQLTLEISILGMLAGSIIGIVIGFLRASKNPIIKNISRIYVEIFRGSPLIIQLFIIREPTVPPVYIPPPFVDLLFMMLQSSTVSTEL